MEKEALVGYGDESAGACGGSGDVSERGGDCCQPGPARRAGAARRGHQGRARGGPRRVLA